MTDFEFEELETTYHSYFVPSSNVKLDELREEFIENVLDTCVECYDLVASVIEDDLPHILEISKFAKSGILPPKYNLNKVKLEMYKLIENFKDLNKPF